MQHLVEHKALSKHAVSLVVCTTMVATPVSQAYAAPLDGVVDFATSSPLVTFGLGCAAGAVVGGLAVGLSGKRARKRLQDEIDEVVEAAERAEESARRAEALVAEYEAAQSNQPTSSLKRVASKPAPAPKASEQPNVVRGAVQATNAQAPAAATHTAATKEAQPAKGADSFETNVLSKDEIRQRSAVAKTDGTNGQERRRGLRGATGRLMNLPVIDRGQPRSASESPFVVAARPQQRKFDPTVRANLIDRRVPRFDESLFPDTTNELHQDVDVFETAMRAMDATLSETKAPEQAPSQATADLARSASTQPDPSDTSSYVESLVQEELERNRNGAGRRFSRAHLTMFEGTGDLGAARKALQYRPRHMQKASKEA